MTGLRQLLVRPIDQFESTSLVNSESTASNPFLSADGEWIGFFTDGMMKKIPVRGGAAVDICPIDGFPRGASWGPDDTIVFAFRGSDGLKRVSASGGEPATLTIVDREGGELNHRWPVILPDGDGVVFEIYRAGGIEASSLAALSLDTGEVSELIRGGSFPRYATSGHLVYAGTGTLWAAGFDSRRLVLTSSPVPVLQRILTTDANAAHFDLSRDGTLVYAAGDRSTADRQLVWVNRRGREEPVGRETETHPYASVALSPDGDRVATEIREANDDVWIYELVQQTLTRFTFDAEAESRPIWTSDGRRIVFNVEGSIISKMADGTGEAERLPATGGGSAWSSLPDNDAVLATRSIRSEGTDIELVTPEEARPIIQERFNQTRPSLSPDGRWIAYESDESGRWEIYVRPYPDVTWKRQISTRGGQNALWARSGRELFYRSDDAMMVVAIETEPSFSASSPVVLFEDPYYRDGRRNYDIDLDDQRFLMIKELSSDAARPELRVVLNWFQELERLVPTP